MFPTGFGQPLFLAAHAAQAQAVATVAAANAAAMQRASLMNVPLPRNTPQPPMLVPAGMAADDHLDPHADVWKEYETDDGRKYYYNKQTKQSSWSKPDENAAEKAESWREYKSDDGRVYYYNTITKKTQWDKPDVLNAAPAVANGNNQPPPAAAPALEVQHKVKSDESSEMEKAMRATLESLSTKKDTNDQDDDERSKKNRQTEIFRELLKDKYNDSKITATCSWEQAVKWLQQDPRFRVLPKVSEKKQLFNSWKVQRQKEERDEKRLAIKKAKEELEKWLQECPKMKPSLKYSRACSLFAKEPAWQAVSDSDREEIFKDTMVFVTKREAEKEEATRTRNIKALAEILESMDQITYKTTWAQAQRLLIENPQFAEDKTLQSMDKEDALIVFEEHIRNAEKEFEEEKKNEEKRFKRSERKVREKFQAFLVELHKKGELTSMSLWSSLYPLISIEPRFEAMLTQTGSTPLDLFKFYVEELKDQFCQDRRVIKEILNKMDKTVCATTTYEEFAAWVTSDEKGAAVDQGNMKLCFNSFMEKAESKEKEAEREETRKKRRLESEFRNLLRAHQPQIDDSAEWESVRSKIDKEKAYLALESDEVREKCFEEYKVSLNDTCGHHHSNGKKKKKDKKKKRDSDSEEDKKDKDRKKRRHDSTDDEKNRKKKSRKRSSSRSDDERKSPTPED